MQRALLAQEADIESLDRAIGDGDHGATILPLIALDVAGHEMSHGVNAATANLAYSGDAGGLNEANSDILGTLVEFYANNPADPGDYRIGEIMRTGGLSFRDMYNQGADGKSFNCYIGGAGFDPNLAAGGIHDPHYTSGVANRAFFLFAEGVTPQAGFSYTKAQLVCNNDTTIAGIGLLGWHYATSHGEEMVPVLPKKDPLAAIKVTPSMRATAKYFWVVIALFLAQIALGAATAHYQVEGQEAYGIKLAEFLPYSLTRSWHTQLAVLWIATAWLGTGLYIAPDDDTVEDRWRGIGIRTFAARQRDRRAVAQGQYGIGRDIDIVAEYGVSIADLVDTLQSLPLEDAADALTQMPDARAVAVDQVEHARRHAGLAAGDPGALTR